MWADVRSGSKPEVGRPNRVFRVASESRHQADITGGPKSATSGFMRREMGRLLDDLVGEREQLVRDRQSRCLRGLEIDNEIELGRLLDWNFLWARPA
jgi:hypothetical protein